MSGLNAKVAKIFADLSGGGILSPLPTFTILQPPLAANLAEENAALRVQNVELMRAQTANGERIAALVADKAELQAEVRRLMEDLSALYSKAARPDPVAEEPSPVAHALGYSWATARYPTAR